MPVSAQIATSSTDVLIHARASESNRSGRRGAMTGSATGGSTGG
jgi:hypothetical protein